jgi:acetyl esterase/lipase
VRPASRGNLVFGVYDVSGTPSQRRGGVQSFRDLYLPKIFGDDRKHPDISPLYADLSGLPPALFTVGTSDYLYDDSLFMHARWRAAGNDSELAIYLESVHHFTVLDGHAARAANARIDPGRRARVTKGTLLSSLLQVTEKERPFRDVRARGGRHGWG